MHITPRYYSKVKVFWPARWVVRGRWTSAWPDSWTYWHKIFVNQPRFQYSKKGGPLPHPCLLTGGWNPESFPSQLIKFAKQGCNGKQPPAGSLSGAVNNFLLKIKQKKHIDFPEFPPHNPQPPTRFEVWQPPLFRLVLANLWNSRVGQRGFADRHFMPQWVQCPYCSLNFTVHARIETLEQDELYFANQANITTKIKVITPPSKNQCSKHHFSPYHLKSNSS